MLVLNEVLYWLYWFIGEVNSVEIGSMVYSGLIEFKYWFYFYKLFDFGYFKFFKIFFFNL